MSVLVGILVGVVTAWFLRIAGRDMLQLPALERTNYRGVPLPTVRVNNVAPAVTAGPATA